MYCSSCGVVVAQGLSYCNYCGAKSSGAKSDNVTKSSEVKPGLLVPAMVFLFVFGLIAIILLMFAMKMLNLNTGQILAFMLLSFLIMLTVEGVFIRLLFQSKPRTKQGSDAREFKALATKELHAAQARGLAEPLPSVTEHTTRAFNPVYRDKPSK